MPDIALDTLEVVEVRPAGPGAAETCFEAPRLAAAARPGQFVMLRSPEALDPLLPRPMSIYRVEERDGRPLASVLYNIVGAGTRRLAAMHPGQRLNVLGPLGRGFRLDPPPAHACLVAGGIGYAGLGLLAHELRRLGVATTLLYGARSERDLVGLDDLETLGLELVITTDDGSRGRKGLVTEELEQGLVSGRYAGSRIYACGPTPMLRAVRLLAERFRADAQLALEAPMACGFGICLGCIVPTPGGGDHKLCCQDGPVFDWQEVLL